jgi:hypothetical protein
MKSPSKYLILALLLAALGLGLFIDRVVCGGMTYHDYAAGNDKRFNCPWK